MIVTVGQDVLATAVEVVRDTEEVALDHAITVKGHRVVVEAAAEVTVDMETVAVEAVAVAAAAPIPVLVEAAVTVRNKIIQIAP